jgi:hypothetical protein
MSTPQTIHNVALIGVSHSFHPHTITLTLL